MLARSPFKDRVEAGRMLAQKLLDYRGSDAFVLSIPRGGVVVGFEVARELEAKLDVVMPRKIGAPGNPELAVGAVAEDGTVTLNSRLISDLNIPEEYLQDEVKRQVEEIRRRVKMYRSGSPPPRVGGKNVILVDDGLATGYTMKVAATYVRKQSPSSIVIAVPVAPADTVEKLGKDVEKLVCLYTPEPFYAISQFYLNFEQVSDEEVIKLLNQAKSWIKSKAFSS